MKGCTKKTLPEATYTMPFLSSLQFDKIFIVSNDQQHATVIQGHRQPITWICTESKPRGKFYSFPTFRHVGEG